MKLTPAMHAALTDASKRAEGLRRVHDDKPGRPPWPANACTLAALVRHGLLVRSAIRHRKGWPVDLWTITDAGREALEPARATRRGDTPRFLARSIPGSPDYTTNPRRAIDELEVIDAKGFAAEAHLTDALLTAERRARDLQNRARALRRKLAMREFRTEQQRRQVSAQLEAVEMELRAAAEMGRLAA